MVPAGREVGAHLVSHPGVDKVSFTGSTVAGRAIGAACGQNLKRVSLELGGKSAAILLDDVDLAESIPLLLPNAIMNNGEACISLTQILAPRDRYSEVTDALVEQVRAMKVGDALDPATEVGPLVAERQRDRVENYIRIGQDEGRKSRSAAAVPRGSTRDGSSSPLCSWTSTTPCASPKRRSSGRCSRSFPTTMRPTLCASPTTPSTACAGRRLHRGQRPGPGRGPPGANRHVHGQLERSHRLLLAVRRLQGLRGRDASSARTVSSCSWRKSRSACRRVTPRASRRAVRGSGPTRRVGPMGP